jgi:hypothetical protein
MSKRHPEEVLRILQEQAAEDQAFEDTASEVSQMSEADLDAELLAAGIDPDEVVKTFSLPAHLSKAEQPPASDKVARGAEDDHADAGAWVSAPAPSRIRQRPRRWAMLLAATLGAVAVGGTPLALRVLAKHREYPVAGPDAAPTGSVKPSPAQLRSAALAACGRHEWRLCLEGLNAARDLDPQGDSDPLVQAARQQATEELRKLEPNGEPESPQEPLHNPTPRRPPGNP